MMLDLDHFKRINDEHGHRAGDLVLRRAAQAMRKAMRADSLLARYGGEEFCAIVPVDGEDDAARAAERIRDTLSRLALSVDQRPLRLSVSIGLAVQRGDLRFDELLAIADEGVYLAKAQGRDCVIAPGAAPAVSRPARPRAAPRVRPA
jgi:diguanylate cyclase (GGDEF)-like protein